MKIVDNIKSNLRKFGLNTIIVIFLIYFAQGFRSFGTTAQILFFKNLYSLNPSNLSLVSSLVTLSWYFKPIYGLISDSIPVFGYYRKYYILFSGLLGISSHMLIFFSESLLLSILALILSELSQAIADVICDGFMVEKSRIDPENGANFFQRISWGTYTFASILGTFIGGSAADYIDPRFIVGLVVLCPVINCIAFFYLDEKKDGKVRSLTKQCRKIGTNLELLMVEAFKPRVIKFITFLLLWKITLVKFDSIFEYYLLDSLSVQPSLLAYYTLLAYVGGFLATFVGSNDLIRMNITSQLIMGRILYSLLFLVNIIIVTKFFEVIGINFYFLIYGLSFLTRFIDTLFSRMLLFIIVTRITPIKVEAAFYSLLASFFNIGGSLNEVVGSAIMKVSGIDNQSSGYIYVLFLISIIVGLASVGLIGIVYKDIERLDENNTQNEGNKRLINK